MLGGRRSWGAAACAATVLALAGSVVAGCAAGTTKTVTIKTVIEKPAPRAPRSPTSPNSNPPGPGPSTPPTTAPPARPNTFHGTGQQDLGTISVPVDSIISWNCPSCANTNFIINNAHSDQNYIPTNGLDQTQGVDPIPAGVYHTVVVNTTGGPWTVEIGGTAPPPSGPPASTLYGQGSSSQCDPNISVSGSADCPFAENTFYEYWVNHGASRFSVYSPSDSSFYTVSCSSSGDITCTTDQGATVQFPQSAIDSYSQSQANSYARSHTIGP